METLRRDDNIGLFAAEAEAGQRAVGLFHLDGGDGAFGGHRKRKAADALFLALGLTGQA